MSSGASRRSAVRRLLAGERARWRDLVRWLLRRPVGHAGRPFGYARTVTPVLAVFVGLSVVEILAVHLLLPWPPVRAVALVLGIYALAWMLGMLAGLRLHPHTLTDDGVQVRSGAGIELSVPWAVIRGARARVRSVEGWRSILVSGAAEQRVVSLPVAGSTNVDLLVDGTWPAPAVQGDPGPVAEVRLFADDPRGLVADLRRRLDADRGARGAERESGSG